MSSYTQTQVWNAILKVLAANHSIDWDSGRWYYNGNMQDVAQTVTDELALQSTETSESGEAVVSHGIPTITECRPEVLAFACLMEAKLRQNDHKGGWKDCNPQWLMDHLELEVDELRGELTRPEQKCDCHEAVCSHTDQSWKPDIKRTGYEAADVANFAMMIADRAGALDIDSLDLHPLTLEMVENALGDVYDSVADPNYWPVIRSCWWDLMTILRKQLGVDRW